MSQDFSSIIGSEQDSQSVVCDESPTAVDRSDGGVPDDLAWFWEGLEENNREIWHAREIYLSQL